MSIRQLYRFEGLDVGFDLDKCAFRCLAGFYLQVREREFFIDNLLVRIHFIIEMIWWTGLAPWEFEFPFPGSLTSIYMPRGQRTLAPSRPPNTATSALRRPESARNEGTTGPTPLSKAVLPNPNIINRNQTKCLAGFYLQV